MAYIGSTPTSQNFTSGTDYFSGTGSQTAYTLTRTVNSVNDIEVVINNVVQQPSTAYTLSGTTITFTSAPSSGTNNIYVRYLATNMQSFTVPANSISRSQLDSNLQAGFQGRNKIINGSMVVDQRNAGASSTSANSYTVDRWRVYGTQSSKWTWQQSTTAPTGFINSLSFTSSSAYTILSTDIFLLQQPVEGLNISDFGWGTANAKTVTVSFWARSSLTGTFAGSVRNSASNRSYVFTYSISSADTWEYKTITIAGDTTGTWLTTSGVGLALRFSISTGANGETTAGSWQGADYYSTSGAVDLLATSGATFYITGVQLEEGTTATSFEREAYSVTLQKCQRYFEKSFNTQTAPANGANSTSFLTEEGLMCAIATNRGSGTGASVTYKVSKRANPTITQYGNNAGQWGSTAANGGTPAFASGLTAAKIGVNSFTVNQQVTDGVFLLVSGHWAASAEL